MSNENKQIDRHDWERLQEVKDEMRELLDEVQRIIRHGPERVYARAKAYCLPQIAMAVDDDHDYCGSAGCNLQEVIDFLEPIAEDEDGEEDETYSEGAKMSARETGVWKDKNAQ